ncbi:MAG: DUF5658 family protein [Pseudomonadota bacterium]
MTLEAQELNGRAVEQRSSERRSASFATLRGALFLHRRRNFRRTNDHVNAYQDWHGHLPLAAALLILMLCTVDAFLTTVLLNEGAVEMNVFMNWLLQQNIHAFTIVKMALTGIALLILVMHYNFMIYRYIAVKYVIFTLVPAYGLLIAHELNMLASI